MTPSELTLTFESNYRQKILYIGFKASSCLKSQQDVSRWRTQWMEELKSWHSPYKVVIDCSSLEVLELDEKTKQTFLSMFNFFKHLHMRAIVGFGLNLDKGHNQLPFDVYKTFSEAAKVIGIRNAKLSQAGDFRSTITFDNHFKDQIIELSFTQETHLDSEAKIITLKSKLLNNLMLWHSSWSLLIDCSNLEIKETVHSSFAKLERVLKGFFLKQILGYQPKTRRGIYPFQVYLSRHQAVSKLEQELLSDGGLANCQSRKTKT